MDIKREKTDIFYYKTIVFTAAPALNTFFDCMPNKIETSQNLTAWLIFIWKGCTNSMHFDFLSYVFEPLHILSEIVRERSRWNQRLRLWWNILLKQNVKLNPPTAAAISHERSEYFTLRSNISPTRKGGFSWKTDLSKQVGFSGGEGGIRPSATALPFAYCFACRLNTFGVQ